MGFFIPIRVIIEILHFNSFHICSKKEYGRILDFAGYIECGSEDNQEYNRPDQNAQEEKRMNFVRKYAYTSQNNPYICSAYHLLITLGNAGRELALRLQAFFMSA